MAEGEEGAGFKIQSIASLLKAPIVMFIIAFILFGPIVLTSFSKMLPMIPFNIWVVIIVIVFVYRWLK